MMRTLNVFDNPVWRRGANCSRSSFALAALLTLGGCAIGSSGLGEEAGTVELPTGLRMLSAVDRQCEDVVEVGAGSLTDAELGPALFVQPGENATFALRETQVNWACIDDDSREFQELDCPEEASFVRITRVLDEGELLLECFG